MQKLNSYFASIADKIHRPNPSSLSSDMFSQQSLGIAENSSNGAKPLALAYPSKPKSPSSIFVSKNYMTAKKEHPNLKKKEIGTLLFAKWRSLPDVERQPYLEVYKADRERFDRGIQQLGIPKRPRNAMSIFVRSHYSSAERQVKTDAGVSNRSKREIVKISRLLGERWKALSDTDRQLYRQLEAEDRRRYYAELDRMPDDVRQYLYDRKSVKSQNSHRKLFEILVDQQKNDDDPETKKLRNGRLSVNKVKILKHKYGKPTIPTSPYSVYLIEAMPRLPAMKGKSAPERGKLISAQWKTMSMEDREKYYQRFSESFKRYKTDVETWRQKMITDGNGAIAEQLMSRHCQTQYRRKLGIIKHSKEIEKRRSLLK